MCLVRSLGALLLFLPLSSALGAPGLTIVPEGLQGGNWVWRVDLTPDLSITPDSITPLAFELGFQLTGAPLISATNINPAEFDTPNPGNVIFGWEMLTDVNPGPGVNLKPVGLQVNTAENGIFAAIGTVVFNTPTPKPFLEIITQGPSHGGGPFSTIEWLGAYGGKGRIAQLIMGPPDSANFDIYAGTATQAIPEPVTAAYFVSLVAGWIVCNRRRN